MKVIKASAELLNAPEYATLLDTVERAGRTCYKSEDKIKEGSAGKFIKAIIARGHESVLEHSLITVRFVCDRGVSHEIVRHRLASFCVTGDTVLHSFQSRKGYGAKRWTVRQLYEWSQDPKRKGRIQLMNMRSVDEDSNIIVKNKMVDILYNGEKPVYEIETESGRKLKCTADHKIYTPNGYVELQNLSVGDYVYANGKELLENPEWLRKFYIEENHTRKETAEYIGCCESYVYRAFKKYGIVKPLSDRPNRHPGRGVKGAISAAGRKKLSELHIGSNNPQYKTNREDLTCSGGRIEAGKRYGDIRKSCSNCGSDIRVQIHHIDKNPRHNDPNNIKILCERCHRAWHLAAAQAVFSDKIVSVKYVGIEPVYDVQMSDPFHNFVANGIVVHNCQASTRYCNYSQEKFNSEIAVIKPCFFEEKMTEVDGTITDYSVWYTACKEAEGAYFALLDRGCTPEEARSVLPNSLATELVMSANIREWRHFLRLRCSPAAHPQMREVACELAHILKQRYPVFFEDLQ